MREVLLRADHPRAFHDTFFRASSVQALVQLGTRYSAVRSSLLVLFTLALAPCGLAAENNTLLIQRAKLDASYRQQLEELAEACREKGLDEQAARTAAWLPRAAPAQLLIYVDSPEHRLVKPAGASAEVAAWVDRFAQLRKAQAIALFDLAREAADAGQSSLAMIWLTETIRENPYHAEARRILGYRYYRGQWLTPYAQKMHESGRRWHDTFGWIDEADVPRYERGDRRLGHRWISAEQDAQRHAEIDRGWEIDTQHYRVTTNHSLAAGVQLAARLERLHEVWRQVFAGFLIPAAQLQRAFAGETDLAETRRTPLDVVFFRTRDAYNRHLVRSQPRIEMTLGIYFDSHRKAYFYAPAEGEAFPLGTLYHEATHQLFQETRRATRNLGERHNFWIIEGIATYMESLAEGPGYFTLGGLNAGRVPAARHRLLVDQFYVPFAELVALGKHDLQRDPRIRSIYSQAAGQTTFLMHAEEGRYRQALVDYLADVYQGKANEQTLARQTGRSYAELDQAYREFLD